MKKPPPSNAASEPIGDGSHRHVHVTGQHIDALTQALIAAFDLNSLRSMTLTKLDLVLDNVVAVERPVPAIALDLVQQVVDDQSIGIKGLLKAALAQNPGNPELQRLNAEWNDLVFDTATPCPYPGMSPFGEDQSDRFFGRNREVDEAIQRLRLFPFLVIIGASGSGKSSLVFAGCIPQMRQGSFFGRETLVVRNMRPSVAPMTSLATALGCASGESEEIVTSTQKLASGVPIVLVVDQFEETYTLSPLDEGMLFEQCLLTLAGVPNFHLILTVRADFYPNLMRSPLWNLIQAHRMEVTALNKKALREAIAAPAKQAGVSIEDALVERLLADAAGEPGALPFLQETLVLLWEKVKARKLALSAYIDLAGDNDTRTGLQVAMARSADQALLNKRMPAEGAITTRRIFMRLIQFGEGRPDTRRQQTEADLRSVGDDPAIFGAVLALLIDKRLLTTDRDHANPQRKIDIAHESLITGWPTLASWVSERRDAEQTRRRLDAKAAEWVRLGRAEGGLLDEAELPEAERWMTTTDAESVGIDQDIKDLVEQSRQQIDAEKQKEKAQQEKELRLLRESRNRWRLLVAGAVLFSVLMFGAVLFILNQQSQLSKSAADLAAQLAQSRSREVAAVANNLLENGDAEEALLLGIIAQQGITGTMQSEEVLRTALDAWRGVASISGLEAAASGIFFSRDNRYLLTGGNDRKARVWDWQSRRLVWALGGHEDTLVGAALSFDGKYVVTASKNDRRVRVWRMSDGGLEWEKIHDDVVRSISLHPGGKWLGVRSGTKIWIWDIISGVLVGKSPYLAESGAQLRTLSWTTDGESILAGADDNLAHIWRIADGASGSFNVPEGRGHQFTVIGAQQSPDGRTIVSLSTDLLELWIRKSISSSYEYVELPDSRNTDGYRFHALFSPDSRYLAAGSANGKVRVWDLGSLDDRPIQLAGHTQEINGLTFSPDSRFLVSGSRDGTIQLWNLLTHAGTTIVRTQPGNISSPVFDRTGHLIATADNQGNVNLWRVRVGGELTSYFPYGLPAQALDDAGSSILVAGENGLVERWSTMEGSATAFDLGDVRLTSIATLPDGHVAVGDEFGQIHVLDRSGQQLSTWQAHQGAIQTVLAGTDGQLVSAGADPVIKTWDPNTGALLEMFQGHTNDVRDLVLNSEKNTVWSAGADGLLLGHGLQANTVVSLTANVPLLAVAVSQDERYIAAADVTARIHFWNRGNGQHWTQRTSKPVHTMVFDSSGRLITGNESGEIEFWNPDQRTTMSLQAHPQLRSVRDLILFEGGRFLVSLADDGQVKVWPLQLSDLLNLACQRAGRDLSKAEWDDLFAFSAPLNECAGAGTSALPAMTIVTRTLGANASNLPLIYELAAISGTIVDPEAPVLVRWNTENAQDGVYYAIGDGELQPTGSPGQGIFTFTEDTEFKLYARNQNGEQSLGLWIDVRGQGKGE